MRSKIAIALAVLGLLLLALGVGQRTVWRPQDTVTASVAGGQPGAPVTVIDSKVRTLRGGPVTVTIKSSGKILLAEGRSDDVDAWVGKAAHLTVDGADADFKALTATHTDGDATVPNPSGSDLWVDEQSGNGQLSYQWQAPADGDWSLLLASDGTSPAPADVSVTTANNASMPWAVPLIVGGVILLIAGVLLLVFKPAKPRGARSGRGDGNGTGPGNGNGSARRAAAPPARPAKRPTRGDDEPGRTLFARRSPLVATLAGLVLLGAVAPAANASTAPAPSPDSSSSDSSSPAPAGSPSPSPAAAAPVVLDSQFTRILDAVANTVAGADTAKDAKQLPSRVDGSALALRTGNYRIRSSVGSYAAVTPVNSGELLTKVISTSRTWPRAIMAVTKGDKNPTPQLLTMVQQSARDNYKLTSATPLLPGQTFPKVDGNGSGTVAADSKDGLQLSPNAALAALGDRLTKTDSQWKAKISDSPYISDVASYQQEIVKGSPDGTFTFAHAPVADSTYAFKTADGGSIVVGNLVFTVDGTPKSAGAKINVASDAAVFSGGKETSTGMQLTFGEPVVMYVPADGSKDPMTLLAATRGLTGAKFK